MRYTAHLLLLAPMIVFMVWPHSALASDVHLYLSSDGKIIDAQNHVVSELYHGWRTDILFTPLSRIHNTDLGNLNVILESSGASLATVNPQLYAIHGARSSLVLESPNKRIWQVIASPASQITIVAQVPSGVLTEGLFWRIFASLSKVSDQYWIVLSVLIPILCILLLYLRKWFNSPHRSLIAHMYPDLLKVSPAALTVLYRGFVSRRASGATLVDLARRGHIQMLIRQNKIALFKRESTDPLRPHELQMLNRWFNQDWNSHGANLSKEIKTQLINDQSKIVNLTVYTEVEQYNWFTPPPLITHWKMFIITFLLTAFAAGAFVTIYIMLPTALPLLWFLSGVLTAIAILYGWTPMIAHLSENGHSARYMLSCAKAVLADQSLVHTMPNAHDLWETWLPLAIVLGVAPQWLERWKKVPFQQPSWFLTPEPIREFDQFLIQLGPILRVASESIRDTILPAYV